MGKVNFHGYLISRFYPTHDICGNFMHTKIHVLQYLLKFGCLLYSLPQDSLISPPSDHSHLIIAR